MPSARTGTGTCGCLAHLYAALDRNAKGGAPGRQAAAKVSATSNGDAPVCPDLCQSDALTRQNVQDVVAEHLRELSEGITKELRSTLERLLRMDTLPPETPSAVDGGSPAGDNGPPPARHRRPLAMRRWTCTGTGIESIASILEETSLQRGAARCGSAGSLRPGVRLQEDSPQKGADALPGSSDPDVHQPEPEDHHGLRETQRAAQSPKAVPDAKSSGRTRISFSGVPDRESSSESDGSQSSDDHTDNEDNSAKSGSSVGWRIDALDCGDRLAASAAAKKGSASVESIVDIIQYERDRWAEEKLALEARLSELKEQRQMIRCSPDSEIAELKRKVQQLRETMKARSRFGAWVCERHMQESDDDEESTNNVEKEALRETMAALELELRDARRQALSNTAVAAILSGRGSSAGKAG